MLQKVLSLKIQTIQTNDGTEFIYKYLSDDVLCPLDIALENTLQSIKHNNLPALLVGRKNVIRTDVLERFLALNQGVNLLNFESVKTI